MAARIAAFLRIGLVSEAQEVRFENGAIETRRLMYGGAVVRSESFNGLGIITVAPAKYAPVEADPEQKGEIITIDTAVDSRVTICSQEPIVRQGADIASASRVVGVGRGIVQPEDLKMIRDLAHAIGAEIGCTRSIAEEYHWLPNESYIGISGRTIKPEIYISIGVSGQIQHVVGVRDAKTIIAVDLNEKAPIFDAADYGIVGDLYEIVPLLTAALKN
jgi:electron transfer flavoprotein alpha subunit